MRFHQEEQSSRFLFQKVCFGFMKDSDLGGWDFVERKDSDDDGFVVIFSIRKTMSGG